MLVQVITPLRMSLGILLSAMSKFHFAAQLTASACLAAMTILRSRGTAVEAVEAAIMILEDNEITNSGYGSNLTEDGIVEGDATIVDHRGMSGAVGAVARKFSLYCYSDAGRGEESYQCRPSYP